jgi:hypothetical protein
MRTRLELADLHLEQGTPKDFHNFATLKERVIALEAENRRLQRALREAAPSQYPDPAYRPPGLWVVS